MATGGRKLMSKKAAEHHEDAARHHKEAAKNHAGEAAKAHIEDHGKAIPAHA